jgi:arginase
MRKLAVLDAPSILGLRPSGVENLPDALKSAGLLDRLGAEYGGRVDAPEYRAARDPKTMVLNADGIREFSKRLAASVAGLLQTNRFPIVLGGDCSILIGNLLALRRIGRHGLFFIDGHADFYQPAASTTGQVADMGLAIVSGRGPEILADIDGLRPLARDKDIVLFGNRDADQAKSYGSQDVNESYIHVFDLQKIQDMGISLASTEALAKLSEPEGFWVHLDVDVLNDEVMPAVDYRLPGGLGYEELAQLLQAVVGSGRAVGMDLTIFNPNLDPGGTLARRLVLTPAAGLSAR